jgi:hypothetical protein
LIPTGEVKGQETRRSSLTPVGLQSSADGKTDAAGFDHAYALAVNLAGKELSINPKTPNEIYTATAQGIVSKSADGGTKWKPQPTILVK